MNGTFLESLLLGASGSSAESLTIGHFFLAMGAAWFGGVLASLTPCVYPMIPITVSVVSGVRVKDGRRKSWAEVWVRGLTYVSGMCVTYSFLGVLAGLTGKVFGSFTNTPGWYLGLGIVLTLSALLMLDVFSFDPAAIWSRIKRKLFGAPSSALAREDSEVEVSLFGAFTLGAGSGFVFAPCTTPVLASILAVIAKTQSVGLGLALMLSFSVGLGTLLLAVAVFAGAAQILPRSGKWMHAIKIGGGLILLGFAQYLIYRAGQMGGI